MPFRESAGRATSRLPVNSIGSLISTVRSYDGRRAEIEGTRGAPSGPSCQFRNDAPVPQNLHRKLPGVLHRRPRRLDVPDARTSWLEEESWPSSAAPKKILSRKI